MPVIQMPNPLTAASEAVGGYTEQVEKNKAAALLLATLRQRQQAEQEKLDIERKNAEATNAYRTEQLTMERKKFGLEQTKAGIDPATGKPITPPPVPATPAQAPQFPLQMQSALGPAEQQQIQDTPPISKTDVLKGAAIGLPKEMAGTPLYTQALSQLEDAQKLTREALYYTDQGASDIADQRFKAARELRDEAHQTVLMANELNKDARDFEKFSETVRFHHATEAKWSKEAKEKAKHEKDVLTVMIQRNEITREDALTRYAASLAAIGAADLRHRETMQQSEQHFKIEHPPGWKPTSMAAKVATPVQRAAAIRGAEQLLNSQQVKRPNDPHLDTLIGQLSSGKATVEEMIKDPAMPENTKAYLQRLAPMLP